MIWSDKGFLISKIKYNENSLITEFFSQKHGKISGIIFGGTSNKVKGYLQIGNLFHLNYNTKNDSKIGAFKVEIINPFTPMYFNNRKKLHSITSAMSLIRLLTAENQVNEKIFQLSLNFFKILNEDDWLKNYLFWELELLKLVGYELNFEKFSKKTVYNDTTVYFAENTKEKKIIPNFFIDRKLKNLKTDDLISGFHLISNYLEKNILLPNNLNHPIPRIDFINILR